MASWQAHVAVWFVKWKVRRRLHGLRDPKLARGVLRGMPCKVPSDIRISESQLGGVPVEWVESRQTAGESPDRVLLYLHGGGYFACSAATHRAITVTLAREGFRVVAPNYRLAPEFPFPAALDDAVAVYRGLLSEGLKPHDIGVGGDSAGGGLSLALLLALRAQHISLPAAAALFSPWTDLAVTGESIEGNNGRCAMFHGPDIVFGAKLYLGSADPRDPLASPLYGDLRGLPPLLIHVGTDEVLRDDSTRFAERARKAGIAVELKVWPVVPHAWQLAPGMIPEARQSLRETA